MAIIQPVSQEGAASFNDDRRPALYATMVIFLVLNNGSVFARLFSQHRTYSKVQRWLFVEDVFIILGGVSIVEATSQSAPLICPQILIDGYNRESACLYTRSFLQTSKRKSLIMHTATHFGLGLHTFRIEETDPHTARNISNVFRVRAPPRDSRTNLLIHQYSTSGSAWFFSAQL